MEYKVESSLRDFQAWSGGKSTLDTLKEKGDCDAVEQYLEDCFAGREDVPTDTEINDILWFESDWIAECLGYRDWEAYEEGWSEDDLRDAEDWFESLDGEELAEVFREREEEEDEDDYLSEATDWWDGLADKVKVEKYEENS